MRIYYFCILACIALRGMEPLRIIVARQGLPPIDPHEYIRKLIKSNNEPEAQKSKVEFRQKINPRFISISLIHEAMRVKDLWYLTVIANTLAEFTKKELYHHFLTDSTTFNCAPRLAPYLNKRIQQVKKQHPGIQTKLKEQSFTLRFNPQKELIYFYDLESSYGFLHAATCFDNIGLIETVLTRYKLDANGRDMDDRTPLFFVKSRAAVQLLCSHNAYLYEPEEKKYIVDKFGKNPLHHIAQQGELEGVRCFPETVNELIAHGASISLRDNRGKTPLECAQEVYEYFDKAGHQEINKSQKVHEAYNYILANPATYMHIAKELRELMRIAEEARKRAVADQHQTDDQHQTKESRLQKRKEYVKYSLAKLTTNDADKNRWLQIFTLIKEEETCPLECAQEVYEYFEKAEQQQINKSQKAHEAYNYILAEPATYMHIAKELRELMRIGKESRSRAVADQPQTKEGRSQERMGYVNYSLAKLAMNDNSKNKWSQIFTLIKEEETCPLARKKAVTDYFAARKSDNIQETNTYMENIEKIQRRQQAIIDRLRIASDSFLS